MKSAAKIIGYSVLVSFVVTLITLAFPRIEPAEDAIWDKTMPVYLSDFTYVPVRGWPLYFVVHTPLGIRLLPRLVMFDIVLWALPSFLVTATIFIAYRVKSRTRTKLRGCLTVVAADPPSRRLHRSSGGKARAGR